MRTQSPSRILLARAIGSVERAASDAILELDPRISAVAEIPEPIQLAVQTDTTAAPLPVQSSIFLSDGYALDGPQVAVDRLIALFAPGVWRLAIIKTFDFIGTTNNVGRANLDFVREPDAAGAGTEFLLMDDTFYTGVHRDKFLNFTLTFARTWALRHVISATVLGDSPRDQITVAALRLF